LKLVTSIKLPDEILIDNPTFDGWIYPDGRTITCDSNRFTRAKAAFGFDSDAKSF